LGGKGGDHQDENEKQTHTLEYPEISAACRMHLPDALKMP
jgi:hypothetical protein